MGPLLVTGAACFGAAVGIGLITAAASRALAETAEPMAVRGLHVILIAFLEGIGVLGVVIGLLAIVAAASATRPRRSSRRSQRAVARSRG